MASSRDHHRGGAAGASRLVYPYIFPSMPHRMRSPRGCAHCRTSAGGGDVRHAGLRPLAASLMAGGGAHELMADGRWQMADGRWRMADGGWRSAEAVGQN